MELYSQAQQSRKVASLMLAKTTTSLTLFLFLTLPACSVVTLPVKIATTAVEAAATAVKAADTAASTAVKTTRTAVDVASTVADVAEIATKED